MSIRVRLTLLYVTLLAVVLFIFSATFYGILSVSLYSEVDRALRDRANQVVTRIRIQNPLERILKTRNISIEQQELDIFSQSSQFFFIQVGDLEGAPVSRSQNLRNVVLPITQRMLDAINQGNSIFVDTTVQTVDLRIYSTPLVYERGVVGIVQVAQPLTEVNKTIRGAAIALTSGAILSLIIITLIGAMMAHLSLRPIDRITSTANQIVSAEDLDRRLPVSGNNDEVDRLSQTINGMLARLENFFQAQIRLSADVSHELRTPLTIIKGNVSLLHECSDDPVERDETLHAIDSALDRMSRIVSDLLLLSQADAGMTLTMRPIELELLLLDVYHQVHALANGVELKLGHTEPVSAHGDADRLKQLLINLVHNGLKHTPKGGCVTLSLYQAEGWARVVIADTGTGISPEDLPHIFERFYRARRQNGKGSGLGLAIAKWIAEAHHGSLTVESQLGNGSTFTLKLPLQSTTPDTTAPDTKPLKNPLQVSLE